MRFATGFLPFGSSWRIRIPWREPAGAEAPEGLEALEWCVLKRWFPTSNFLKSLDFSG